MTFAHAIKDAIIRETNHKVFGHSHPVQHGKHKMNPNTIKHTFKARVNQKVFGHSHPVQHGKHMLNPKSRMKQKLIQKVHKL